MGIIKIYFFFYLSYWLRLLLIVYGDVESNPGPGSDLGLGSSIPTFVIFMPIWTSWLWLDRIMFWFEPSLKSLIATFSQELHIPDFRCTQRLLQNSTPVASMAFYDKEGFHSFRQSKLECFCHEYCVFRICSRINNFHVYAFYHNRGHNRSFYNCLLDYGSGTAS